jgi:hypothetical protein
MDMFTKKTKNFIRFSEEKNKKGQKIHKSVKIFVFGASEFPRDVRNAPPPLMMHVSFGHLYQIDSSNSMKACEEMSTYRKQFVKYKKLEQHSLFRKQ